MKLVPNEGRIVVTRDSQESVSAGGIYIPETAQSKSLSGMVLAVGSGGLTEMGNPRPMFFHVGQRVIFDRYAGTEVKIGSEDATVLKVSDVLCVVETE